MQFPEIISCSREAFFFFFAGFLQFSGFNGYFLKFLDPSARYYVPKLQTTSIPTSCHEIYPIKETVQQTDCTSRKEKSSKRNEKTTKPRNEEANEIKRIWVIILEADLRRLFFWIEIKNKKHTKELFGVDPL